MILSDNVWIQKDARTHKYYTDKGYEFFSADFSRYSHALVKVEDLHSKSRASVVCKCDICGKERTLSFYQYREVCHECNNKKPVPAATKLKQSEARVGKRKGELNPSWKGGKPVCKCGTELSNWRGTLCRECFLKRDQHGCNNHAWKNYTEEEAEIAKTERKGYLARRWRIAIRKKFNSTCDICLEDEGKLHAHHLSNWKDNYDARFDEDNGVLLCQQCHMSFHSEYGKTNNTPEQYTEYKESHNG